MPKELPSDDINILRQTVKKLKQENKRLRSENKTLRDAWGKTESYLSAISENKTIKEIFYELDTKTFIRKIDKKCGKCSNRTMNKRQFNHYFLVYCGKCGYRNRVNDAGKG